MSNDFVMIPVKGGSFAKVDECDAEMLKAWKWSLCGSQVKYAACSVTSMHRMIIGAQPGDVVDHVNGDPLDNRRSNLRICTQSQNLANRKVARSSCGFKGVKRKRGLWSARIGLKSGEINLGTYATAEDAAIAYDNKLRELFGEFAHTNFPDKRPTPSTYRQTLHRRCACGAHITIKDKGRPPKWCSRSCMDRHRSRS